MLPHFLCIGAQKAGTTWLHVNLSQHPDLWLPPIKEIHYFDYKENNFSPAIIEQLFGNEGRNRRWRRITKNRIKLNLKDINIQRLLWDINYLFNRQNNDNWYSSLFDLCQNKLIGEITPAYSTLSLDSVFHIHQLMPNAKIIFIMRNPIERAWSYFFSYMSKRNRVVDSFSVEEIINNLESNYSRSRGSYLKTLETWRTYYPKEQFFIVFFEEIVEQPKNLLKKICDFLEVSTCINNISENKINSFGNNGVIPEQIIQYSVQIYREEILILNKQYGGYSNIWLEYI